MFQKIQNKNFHALLAGALLNLAFAPFDFFLASIFSLSVFYFLLEKTENKKEVFWLGFAFGFGHFLCGIYWIAISLLVDAGSFAWLIPFALTLIPAALALYISLFALLYKFILRRFSLEFTSQKIIIFSCCWLFFEILRSVLFSGFPWNLIGYIWLFSPYFAQSSSVFGIYGMSFLAVLISLFPALFLKREKLCDKIFAVILVIIFVANFGYGYFKITNHKIENSDVKLRLVQANIKQEMKWDDEQKYLNLLKHIDLTNQSSLENIDAVFWSETSVPYPIGDSLELMQELQKAVPPRGVLVTGGLRLGYSDFSKREVSQVWNSIFSIEKNGNLQFYDKNHLVPFGEYVPLQKYLPFIGKITDGAMGFSEGEGNKTLQAPAFSFSPLVCYEIIFSDKILDKKNRPELLVNLTNDAWFGNSSGPYQHLNMAKMRAIEYGISLARVANSGVTVFVDPFGRVVNRINLNQEGIFDVNLIKNLAPTTYEKYCYWPSALLVMAMLIFLVKIKYLSHVRKNNSSRCASSKKIT
jgi:apolipoprotein N-acyltransferase